MQQQYKDRIYQIMVKISGQLFHIMEIFKGQHEWFT